MCVCFVSCHVFFSSHVLLLVLAVKIRKRASITQSLCGWMCAKIEFRALVGESENSGYDNWS